MVRKTGRGKATVVRLSLVSLGGVARRWDKDRSLVVRKCPNRTILKYYYV